MTQTFTERKIEEFKERFFKDILGNIKAFHCETCSSDHNCDEAAKIQAEEVLKEYVSFLKESLEQQKEEIFNEIERWRVESQKTPMRNELGQDMKDYNLGCNDAFITAKGIIQSI